MTILFYLSGDCTHELQPLIKSVSGPSEALEEEKFKIYGKEETKYPEAKVPRRSLRFDTGREGNSFRSPEVRLIYDYREKL
jgi:hypothetical protein